MDNHTCTICSGALSGKQHSYCSQVCRQKAKYERSKASGLARRKAERRNVITALERRSAGITPRTGECLADDCQGEIVKHSGLCVAHFNPLCSVSDCGNPRRSGGKGMCTKHFRRWQRANGVDHWGSRDGIRRARSYGVPYEKYDRMEVFESSGWICGICNGSVDRRIAYPDPNSASLDHILPLSLGGGDIRANVQLSHLICNLKKGGRVIGESAGATRASN